jgi:polyadenylate-binding protein
MGGKKIYVGNLQWEVTEADLRQVFSPVGGIESCEVVHSPEGRSRGFGFIEFMTPEDADLAVHTLHDQELKGRKLVVQLAQEKERRPRRDDADHPRPGARKWA